MAFELVLLVWSTALLVLQIAIQGGFLSRQLGSRYNAGPRDEERPLTGVAGRARRALDNFLETYPAFIALALAITLADKSGPLTQWGAGLYLGMRLVYIPLYLLGVPYIRSLVWALAGAGLAMMFWGALA